MAKQVTLYKVFIASPSDVNDERERLKEVIVSFNERYAVKHEVIFMPIYWEQNTGGCMPPQDKANKRLDYCDFSIIIFGKKWGTTPKHEIPKQFSSGTEEEFARAVENYNIPENPMKDVVVLLKELPADNIADPGYNTEQLIRFKKRLEEIGFAYLPYINTDDFASIIANHLNEWLENHIKGGGKIEKDIAIQYDYFKYKHIEHIPFLGEISLDENSPLFKKLRKAAKAADKYNVLEAQEIYEELKKKDPCLPVLNDYAKFLYRIGELNSSKQLFEEILNIARLEQSLGWMARATANLAIIQMSRGGYDDAITLLLESLGYNQELGHIIGVADNHRNMSNVFRLQGDLDLAEEHIVMATNLFEQHTLYSGLADAHADYGVILRIRGKYSESIAHYDMALQINKEHTPDKKSCRADYIDRLGTIHRIRGNLSVAKEHYNNALAINKNLSRRKGMAEVLGHLGLIEFYLGNYEEAIIKIDESISIDRYLNNKVGLAKHLSSKARIFHWRGDLVRAYDSAIQSREINSNIGSKEGIAYSTYILASIQYATKEIERAEKNIDEALLIWHKLKGGEGLAECNELKALILHSKGLDNVALDLIDDALSFCENSGSKIMESSLLISRSNILGAIGNNQRCADLRNALEICIETGERPKREMIEQFLRKMEDDNEC